MSSQFQKGELTTIMSSEEFKPNLQIEARLTQQCSVPYHIIRDHLLNFLYSTIETLTCFQEISDFNNCNDELVRTCVEKIWIGECTGGELDNTSMDELRIQSVNIVLSVYQLHEEGVIEEYADTSIESDEMVMMAHHWTLPCREFEGIWDSLIFDDDLQVKLLESVRTTILFSDKNVNPDLISWNRVALLYGPPGTGKTSLCRALAQKLAIRLQGRYQYGKLLEINSHSLFSKWFSESGKMVQKMFSQIWNMVEDDNAFVCVLIDEVESLAAARKAALSGSEPSDSIRVVNALLTQIDRLKKRRNVLILATSNITEAIDVAFIDRADIKLHIGVPSEKAIYTILASCLEELQRAGVIQPRVPILSWEGYQATPQYNYSRVDDVRYPSPERKIAIRLDNISKLALGMSGRSVRRLPFLAHAGYIQCPVTTMDRFLIAMDLAVEKEIESLSQLDSIQRK